jgi:DNA-binding transcriptional ArsR family regulator
LRVRGLSNGTLDHHLALLERLGLLRATGQAVLHDIMNQICQRQRRSGTILLCKIMNMLRNHQTSSAGGRRYKKWLIYIPKDVQMIGKDPSNVSVQLGKLIDHKVVSFDEKCGYIVKNKQAIKRLLSKYKV